MPDKKNSKTSSKMAPRDIRLVETILTGEFYVGCSTTQARAFLISKDTEKYHEWITIPYDQYWKFCYLNNWIGGVGADDSPMCENRAIVNGSQEYIVIVTQREPNGDTRKVFFNLADLIALARKADITK